MEEGNFDFNISIVGLGMMGGSYAKALRALRPRRIYGMDIDADTVKKAVAMGIIDDGGASFSSKLKESDLVIIALYPDEAIKFVKDNLDNFKTGAVITDICGIKERIVEELICVLPETVEFVGGHPMAGKETCGFGSAEEDIFIGSSYIITPHPGNTEKNLALIEKLAKGIGCRKVVRVDIREHDRIITFTSQLPHVIAVALMNTGPWVNINDSFIGGSFKDATRVAAINANLWLQLLTLNSDRLIGEIERFEAALSSIKQAVKFNDIISLEQAFKAANENRRKMLKNENN